MKRLRHPIRSIREPFGTAGLVVACLALVLATTGAAFAAGGLTKSQEKQIKKIVSAEVKKHPGPAGPAGAVGPAGPKGDTGAAGKDGTNGTPGANGTSGASGKSVKLVNSAPPTCTEGGFTYEVEGSGTKNEVCNGEPGEPGAIHPGETLPSEATETGTFWFEAHGSSVRESAPISFPIPLAPADAAAITVHIWNEEATPHDPSGKCTGTPLEPKADPGNICFYIPTTGHLGMGLEEGEIRKPGFSKGVGSSGAFISFAEGLPRERYVSGAWAITAP